MQFIACSTTVYAVNHFPIEHHQIMNSLAYEIPRVHTPECHSRDRQQAGQRSWTEQGDEAC